ncbi:MAG: Ppx/GppA phosphatase family protein [Actinobacteria bacterium]|nr:Ppx/GppA phosphatase family protein [Actinomycetota bacterium]
MRLGVLDVGSNTIHLQVMDAHQGARPTPTTNYKVELRLTEYLQVDGSISQEGIDLLMAAIEDAVAHGRDFKTQEILAFATSALREARNGAFIIDQINRRFDIDLQILTGDDEARMTFLAVRRWLGWSAGEILILDIGGGSLEIAMGVDESPSQALSLPLGAGRLTREFLASNPFTSKSIKSLENYVADTLKRNLPPALSENGANHFVATSKTFRTLARIASQWYGDSPKYLEFSSILGVVPRLSDMSRAQRADLPGVSNTRAQQIVAGAIVARSTMDLLNISELEICPWALREGVILRWLDWMEN